MKVILTAMALMLGWGEGYAQSIAKEKHLEFRHRIPNDAGHYLHLSNLQGDVIITGSPGDSAIIRITIKVSARSEEYVQKGLQELGLKQRLGESGLFVGMDAPFLEEWWQDGERRGTQTIYEPEYSYRYNFDVRIPRQLSLRAGTVNKGEVSISKVSGPIVVHNVNGSIFISGARNVKKANTVNGSILVRYATNPDKNGAFHTVNGDITLDFQPDPSANIYSKSMNGELFSAIDFDFLDPVTEVSSKSVGRGTVYKLQKRSGVVLGKGGCDLTLETLNGNMYLKKQ